MNYVHSGALTRSLLPNIAPLPAGLFSTPMGLLAFIELLCFKFLFSIDTLLGGLFSTPVGLPCIMILNIWKLIGTKAF